MKSLKFFLLCSLAFLFMTVSLTAQKIQLRTTTGQLFTYGTQATAVTTDATVTTIATIPLATNTAGIIEVSVTGVNPLTGDAITGAAIARFNKAAGTLAIGDTSNILPTVIDTGLSGGTWAIAASANNIIITVKGKAATTVRWRALVKQIQ